MPKVNGINSGIYNMFEVNFMIYHNIRNLREDNDWTQQYVADYLGVNRRTYSAYETGTNSMVPEILIQLSELYDTSVDYLLGLTDVQEPALKGLLSALFVYSAATGAASVSAEGAPFFFFREKMWLRSSMTE